MTKRKNIPRKGNRRGQKAKRPDDETASSPAPRKGGRKPAESRGESRDSPGRNSPWLYGLHPVLAALANPNRVHTRLVVSRDQAATLQSRLAEAVETGGKFDMSAEVLDRSEIDKLLPPAAVHQGLALLSRLSETLDLEDLIEATAHKDRVVLIVLDQASDPHNVGAVLRSAAAFDASALILPDRHTPDITGVLAKAASGAVETVPMIRVGNLVRSLDRLKDAGFWCIGMDGSADLTLPKADLPARAAFVLGAEGAGLRRLSREHCDLLVKVPIGEKMESLNLSNAAAVALYEFTRRDT